MAAALSALALLVVNRVSSGVISPLMLAMLLGAVLGNLWKLPKQSKAGLTFCLKKVLRWGIVLLGFKISLIQMSTVGWQGLIIISLCVFACFTFTVWCGKRLGIPQNLSLLIAAGTSICGASAIIATDSILEADESDTAYAVATITLFGTLAMIAYPLMQWFLAFKPESYGIWVGASIHEVAQVVAAGFAHGELSGQTASMIKMARVIYLIPVTLFLMFWVQKQRHQQGPLDFKKIPVPWFVFGFLGAILLNSTGLLPTILVKALLEVDLIFLTLAMAALGLETNLNKLKASGLKPLYLGLASSALISFLALGLIQILY